MHELLLFLVEIIAFNFIFVILGIVAVLTAKRTVCPWIVYGLSAAIGLNGILFGRVSCPEAVCNVVIHIIVLCSILGIKRSEARKESDRANAGR